MPHYFDFDSANRIVRCRFEGRITDEELKEYYLEAPKYVVVTAPRAAIADFSAVTSLDVSTKTIRELALSPPAIPDPILPRFIVAPSPHVFGLARMFHLIGEETRPNLHVVRTSEEAFGALRAEKPKFEPIPAK